MSFLHLRNDAQMRLDNLKQKQAYKYAKIIHLCGLSRYVYKWGFLSAIILKTCK